MLERHQNDHPPGAAHSGEAAFAVDLIMAREEWSDLVPEAEAWAARVLRATLIGAGARLAQGASLTLLLAGNAEVRDLNRRFRGQDKPTNVLSFPARPMPPSLQLGAEPEFLGDIAFALETVEAEALAATKPFLHHLTHLLVHGTLHLLGFTHDDDETAPPMMRIESAVLARLGIPDPYAGEPDMSEAGAA